MSTSPTRQTFDWSKLSLGTKIAAVSAIVLLISTFLTWITASFKGAGIGISAGSATGLGTGLGKLAALAAVVAIVVLAIEIFSPQTTLPAAPALILLACGALAFLCALYHVVFYPDGKGIVSFGPGFGVFISLIAAAGLAYGGYRRMSE